MTNQFVTNQGNSLNFADRSFRVGSNPFPFNPDLILSSIRRRASDNGGNSVTQATNLGLLKSTPKRLRGTVSSTDPDFFRITLDATRNVKLQFENRSNHNIVGAIVDAQGNVINFGTTRLIGTARPGRRGTLSGNGIPPGTYTFRLTSTGQQPNEYRLRLTADLPLDCGCGS